MDGEAWQQLLAALGPDEPAQAAAYEKLRERLESFFRWKGSLRPDELADETLGRVGHKLAGGETIEKGPANYALGVARFVWLETVKKETREREALAREAATPDPDTPEDDPEEALTALEECLAELHAKEALLIQQYHHGRGQAKIDTRKQLAAERGVSLNSLRLRAFRIRERLEKCMRKKIGNESAGAATHG